MQLWKTGGYMIRRDGDTCRIWLSSSGRREFDVPFDSSMPDWLFDPALNFHGDGVQFNVEIPRDYADADSLDGITWHNWQRQPYDYMTETELFDDLTKMFYPEGE